MVDTDFKVGECNVLVTRLFDFVANNRTMYFLWLIFLSLLCDRESKKKKSLTWLCFKLDSYNAVLAFLHFICVFFLYFQLDGKKGKCLARISYMLVPIPTSSNLQSALSDCHCLCTARVTPTDINMSRDNVSELWDRRTPIPIFFGS